MKYNILGLFFSSDSSGHGREAALLSLLVRNSAYFRYAFLVTRHKYLLLVCDLLAKIFL